jgi:hypothetical protein
VSPNVIQRQLGQRAHLGEYLPAATDTEAIIANIHSRRAPMMSATAGLRL